MSERQRRETLRQRESRVCETLNILYLCCRVTRVSTKTSVHLIRSLDSDVCLRVGAYVSTSNLRPNNSD